MKGLIRQIALLSLLTIFVAVQSMFAFAVTNRTTGALAVVGASSPGKNVVKINGEPAVTGRSIFSANLIETTGDATAVISAGQAGKFQLAANSRFIVSFDNNEIGGELLAGRMTILSAPQTANIKINGQTVKLRAGESADSGQSSGSASSAPNAAASGASWLPWALVIGGAAAALIIGATVGGGSDFQLGTTALVVSPTR